MTERTMLFIAILAMVLGTAAAMAHALAPVLQGLAKLFA